MSERNGWMQTEATAYSTDIPNPRYGPRTTFSYTVDGHYYSGEMPGALKEGEKFTILYSPANPEENDKQDDAKRINLIAWILLGVFVVILLCLKIFQH